MSGAARNLEIAKRARRPIEKITGERVSCLARLRAAPCSYPQEMDPDFPKREEP